MSTVTIDVQVENINTVMLTYDQVKLYRDTDPGGAFSTLVDTETLVADDTDYSLTDSSGSPAYIYRHLFYNSVSLVQSSLSDAYFPTGRQASDIIIAAARKAKGFRSTCTALGTTTTLIDARLAEEGVDEDFLSGAWVYRPAAAAEGDWQRRTTQNPFDVTATSLTLARAYANAPAADEVYAVFGLLPPLPGVGGYSWLEALSDGLAGLLVPDIIDIGTGVAAGTKDRFSLSAHAGYIEKNLVRKVYLRTYNTDDTTIYDEVDASKRQRFWEYKQNGRDDVHLYLSPPPLLTEHVIVDLSRKFDRLYRPDDITLAPFDLAVAITLAKVYEYLNVQSDGKYAVRLATANAQVSAERGITRPLVAVKQ